VLEHVAYLWGFSVRLEAQDSEGKVTLIAERMREKRTGSPSAGP
jgi:stage V sporulation protein R